MSPLPNWKEIDPAERDAHLRRYIVEGLSARQIADRFQNCTRSAVIGRASRLNLRLAGGSKKPAIAVKPEQAPVRAEKLAKPHPVAGRRMKLIAGAPQVILGGGPKAASQYDFKTRAEQRAASPGLTVRREDAFDPIAGIEPVSLVDLGPRSCRWIVNGLNGRDDLFCGAPKEVEHSYCSAHHALAYVPYTARHGTALRSAERIR
jgi:hypothetical protein